MVTRQIDSATGRFLVCESDGLIQARGVRYATADRFAPPVAADFDSEVVDATTRGPACPQLPSRLAFVTGPVVDGLEQREQCLVLSVTAPADADALPVMVWFHGGAYVAGGGEAPKYDPDALVREGRVVVVRVTYRLGILGYLNLGHPGTENLGVRDQICALRWVQDHIAAFGGDPARVTVFGQSAGGDSALTLMACPETRGLFTRAILQSAPLGLLGDDRTAMIAAMREAAASSLAGTSPADAEVSDLLAAQVAALTAAASFGVIGKMAFAPMLDQAPCSSKAAAVQSASQVELLVGYTRDDALPFVLLDPRGARLRALGLPGRAVTALLGRLQTRRLFAAPALALAQRWRDAGGRAGTFVVNWAPGTLGACHCIEIPLLLGAADHWTDAPMLGDHGVVDEDVAAWLRGRWSAFAHDGVAGLEDSAAPRGRVRISAGVRP